MQWCARGMMTCTSCAINVVLSGLPALFVYPAIFGKSATSDVFVCSRLGTRMLPAIADLSPVRRPMSLRWGVSCAKRRICNGKCELRPASESREEGNVGRAANSSISSAALTVNIGLSRTNHLSTSYGIVPELWHNVDDDTHQLGAEQCNLTTAAADIADLQRPTSFRSPSPPR